MPIGRGKGAILPVILVAVIVVASFVSIELLTSGSQRTGPHFGFPTQRQVSTDMNFSVTESKILKENSRPFMGFYLDHLESVYYNGTAGNSSFPTDTSMIEVMVNTSREATAIMAKIYSGYAPMKGVSIQNITYKSVNASLITFNEIDAVLRLVLFSDSSFCCIWFIAEILPGPSISLVPPAESAISAMV